MRLSQLTLPHHNSQPGAFVPADSPVSAPPGPRLPTTAGQPPPELQYSAGLGLDASDLWEAMEDKYMRGREPLPDVRERQQRQGGAAGTTGGGQPAAAVAAEQPASQQRRQQQREEAG